MGILGGPAALAPTRNSRSPPMGLKGLEGWQVFPTSNHRQDISEKPWVPLTAETVGNWATAGTLGGQLGSCWEEASQCPEGAWVVSGLC